MTWKCILVVTTVDLAAMDLVVRGVRIDRFVWISIELLNFELFGSVCWFKKFSSVENFQLFGFFL